MERKEGIVAGAAVALVIYALSLSMLSPAMSASQTNKTISNAGSVMAVGVGVYWDAALTNRVSSIDWGVIELGSSVNKTVYIRNEGNSAATLSMAPSNWSPSNASTCMNLSWNYAGQTLSVGASIQVKFTLSVAASAKGITSFSFDITITASS